MNFLFKLKNITMTQQATISLLITIIVIAFAKLLIVIVFLFVDTKPLNFNTNKTGVKPISLNLSSMLELESKPVENKVVKIDEPKKVEKKSKNIVLKDFKLLATYIEGINKFIMLKDKKNSTIISLQEEYKGYKLLEIRPQIAKFVKDGDFYWLFADPKMEEGFDFDKKREKLKIDTKKSNKKISLVVTKQNKNSISFTNGVYYIPRSKIDEFDNINKIFKLIAISPSYENGKLNGFIVSKVKKGSVFSLIGLKKGDKIVEVNHNPLTKMDDGFYYFSRLKEINSMTLTILRNDDIKELSYEIF